MRKLVFIVVALALVMGASQARADVINLTTIGASGSLTGVDGSTALFIQGEIGSGTGVFPAFVRINPAGGPSITTEAGYNTTVNGVLDNTSDDTHNHEIQVQDLQTFVVNGVAYYGFLLDANETNTSDDRFISLNDLVIVTSATPNQSVQGVPTGTNQWDMKAGDAVLLDYNLEPGSGKSDMTLLIPVSTFGAVTPTTYVYLYSLFGTSGINPAGGPAGNYGVSDGFEEWAIKPGGGVVTPDGGLTAVMLGLSMLGLGFGVRRKNKK